MIRPGVAVAVPGGRGRVLLHRRVIGGWEPLSGAVEPGEYLLVALHREVYDTCAAAAGTNGVVVR